MSENEYPNCEKINLGIVKMPLGYTLYLDSDCTHYFYVGPSGEESCEHWDKWVVYRWAKRKAHEVHHDFA